MNRYVKANIAFSKFGSEYINLKKNLPIRPSEMGVLNIITIRQGQYTPVMLAELLGVSKPMIAAHIASLEEKGYIYKDSSSSDKRSFYIMPTEKAKLLVHETEQSLNEHLKSIERRLGEERFDLLVDLINESLSVLQEENLSE